MSELDEWRRVLTVDALRLKLATSEIDDPEVLSQLGRDAVDRGDAEFLVELGRDLNRRECSKSDWLDHALHKEDVKMTRCIVAELYGPTAEHMTAALESRDTRIADAVCAEYEGDTDSVCCRGVWLRSRADSLRLVAVLLARGWTIEQVALSAAQEGAVWYLRTVLHVWPQAAIVAALLASCAEFFIGEAPFKKRAAPSDAKRTAKPVGEAPAEPETKRDIYPCGDKAEPREAKNEKPGSTGEATVSRHVHESIAGSPDASAKDAAVLPFDDAFRRLVSATALEHAMDGPALAYLQFSTWNMSADETHRFTVELFLVAARKDCPAFANHAWPLVRDTLSVHHLSLALEGLVRQPGISLLLMERGALPTHTAWVQAVRWGRRDLVARWLAMFPDKALDDIVVEALFDFYRDILEVEPLLEWLDGTGRVRWDNPVFMAKAVASRRSRLIERVRLLMTPTPAAAALDVAVAMAGREAFVMVRGTEAPTCGTRLDDPRPVSYLATRPDGTSGTSV